MIHLFPVKIILHSRSSPRLTLVNILWHAVVLHPWHNSKVWPIVTKQHFIRGMEVLGGKMGCFFMFSSLLVQVSLTKTQTLEVIPESCLCPFTLSCQCVFPVRGNGKKIEAAAVFTWPMFGEPRNSRIH